MSDLYAEQLEMQLRFAEEEAEEREMIAYEQGKEEEREKILEAIETLKYSAICSYRGECCGDKSDCENCSDYVVNYEQIKNLKQKFAIDNNNIM